VESLLLVGAGWLFEWLASRKLRLGLLYHARLLHLWLKLFQGILPAQPGRELRAVRYVAYRVPEWRCEFFRQRLSWRLDFNVYCLHEGVSVLLVRRI